MIFRSVSESRSVVRTVLIFWRFSIRDAFSLSLMEFPCLTFRSAITARATDELSEKLDVR